MIEGLRKLGYVEGRNIVIEVDITATMSNAFPPLRPSSFGSRSM